MAEAGDDVGGERLYVMQDRRQVVGNCALFWREGRSGYTCDLDEAHVFTEAEAMSQARTRPDVDRPIPLDVARSLVVTHVRIERLRDWFDAEHRVGFCGHVYHEGSAREYACGWSQFASGAGPVCRSGHEGAPTLEEDPRA